MKKSLLLPLFLAASAAPALFGESVCRTIDRARLEKLTGAEEVRIWQSHDTVRVECSGSDDAAVPVDFDRETESRVLFKSEGAGDIRGRLYEKYYDSKLSRYVTTAKPFTIPASELKPAASADFDKAKAEYYSYLINTGVPGEGWFRYQRDRFSPGAKTAAPRFNRWTRRNETDEMFALFTGSEAIRENLQLDRPLRVNADKSGRTLPLSGIAGITVKEFDWAKVTKSGEVALDPLAACIPHDQHVVFFKGFIGMLALLDEADARGTPLLTTAIPRSEDARTKERYARQLCLETTEFARLAGPHLVKSVAFTGSDLLLPSGSDVGVVFESLNSGVLTGFIRAKQALAAKADAGCKLLSGEIDGVKWDGVANATRTISSYVAERNGVVFLSNSTTQLRSLIGAASGATPALSSLPEYKFFRQRYDRDAADESALSYLSDATIRRWCGPRWRILSARRAEAAAAMTAAASAGVANPAAPAPASEEFGSLAFLTPVAELACDTVTPAESQAYATWRDAYQRGWREFFDPIGVRLSSDAKGLRADVTVMPLILGSDYARMTAFTRGGEIRADSCDGRPGAVLQYAMAIDPASPEIRSFEGMLGGRHRDENAVAKALRPRPLAWLGTALSWRVDGGSELDALCAVAAKHGSGSSEFEHALKERLSRLPVSLWVDNRDAASLAFFLTALRGLSESSAPGLLLWTNTEYSKNTYVTLSSARNSGDFLNSAKLHYHAGPKALFVTLSEEVMKSYLDSLSVEAKPVKPWLGKHAGLRVSPRALEVLDMLSRDTRVERLREASWAALPVLNELHRAAPGVDADELYEKLWGVRLVCPAGGSYVWNERLGTMESTATGSPAEPKDVKPAPFLPGIASGEFGLTFENDGVRARLELERDPAK